MAANVAGSPHHSRAASHAEAAGINVSFHIPEDMQQAAVEEGGGCCGLEKYWTAAQSAIGHFVMEQPLIAIVVTVVFTIFGISQIFLHSSQQS